MTLKLPFVPTLLLSMILTALLGMTIERVAYKPLRHASRLSVVITALGVGLLLENGMLALTGADPRNYPEEFLVTTVYNIGGLSISNVKIIIIVLAFVLFLGLYLIVQRTKWGMAMRAISYDKFAVPLMGVSQNQIIALTFAWARPWPPRRHPVGGGLPVLNPYMGMRVGWKAFIAAVVGGIGDVRAAFLGGLLLGFVEIFVVELGQYVGISSTWRDPIAFALLLIILVVRPTGLFGVARRQKV
jgi:branched-chain amino acid transport system permease protein